MPAKHATHFDDCGCLQDKHEAFIEDLKKEMAERLAIIQNLRKTNAALLEAGKVLFENARHAYNCPEKYSVACNCGFHEATTKWVKAEVIAEAEGKS